MLIFKKEGYSLVEVAVAVSLLAVVLIPIFLLIGQGATSMVVSSNRSIASNLAQEKMEEIRNTAYGSIVNATDSKTVNNITFTRNVAVVIAPSEIILADSGIKKITVTVKWMEYGKERSICLVAYRTELI